jgi:monoterpene epsilon-lactone hydrolase
VSAPVPTDLLGEMYAQWIAEMTKYPDMSIDLLRIIFEDWSRATAEPEDVTYRETTIGGVPGILVTPIVSEPSQILVLMHGGGFALGSASTHRKLAGHLAKALGTHAFVADFRLAPETRFPGQLEDGVSILDALVADGYDIANITLVGDSAGANLAIGMVQMLKDAGKPLPAQVITMSPWLNMENNGETLASNNDTDFLIAPEGLQGNIDRYLVDSSLWTHPLANPLYADFSGFPRLYICASSHESLFDNAVQLDKRARAAGVDVTFSVGEGQQHVYPLLAGRHDRADEEIALIADWYRAGRNAR